jgi:hypothetical protein
MWRLLSAPFGYCHISIGSIFAISGRSSVMKSRAATNAGGAAPKDNDAVFLSYSCHLLRENTELLQHAHLV